MNTYSTFNETVEKEIFTVLQKAFMNPAEYDVTNIAKKLIIHDDNGYFVDPSRTFWEIVDDNYIG